MNEACCGVDGHHWACLRIDRNAPCAACGNPRGSHYTKGNKVRCHTTEDTTVFKSKENSVAIKRTFRHMSGIKPVGTVVSVSNTAYYGAGSNQFLLTGNYVWQTENQTPADQELDNGDTFKILEISGEFVIVEEVKVKRSALPTVTIDLAKFLEEAKKNKTVAAALKRLNPEAFDPGSVPDWSKCKDYDSLVDDKVRTMVERRTSGKYKDHILLGSDFEWKIAEDGVRKILVGTLKKGK